MESELLAGLKIAEGTEEKKQLILNADQTRVVFDIISEYFNQSKYFNVQYKNYIRFFAEGNGILHLIVNNSDLKIIYYIDIELEISIDKIYFIPELTNIFSKFKSYSYFILENDFIIFDDGKFSILPVTISDEEKLAFFNITADINYTVSFNIDAVLNKELETIFKIVDLKKSKTIKNSYFNKDSKLYFDFNIIRVKKPSIFNYITSDIFTLKIISLLFKAHEGHETTINYVGDKFFINSGNFYVEGHSLVIDDIDKQYVENLFNMEKEILLTIKSKLELYYFAYIILGYDANSSLYFNGNLVKVNSSFQNFVAEFKIEGTEGKEFIIKTDILISLLKFVLSYGEKLSNFEFNIIKNKAGKFVDIIAKDVEILSEVI